MKVRVLEDPGAAAPDVDLVLCPGTNLATGEAELAAQLGSPLNSMEADLMRVASAVFAADLANTRGERERHSRRYELTIPVANLQAFQRVAPQLRVALYLLSDDAWTLDFVQGDGHPTAGAYPTDEAPGATLLFSGGLDSFAGAVAELEGGRPLTLVSHYTRSPAVRGAQNRVATYLGENFEGGFDRFAVHMTGVNTTSHPFPSDPNREPSQRTRSFMFLTLGSIIASRTGQHRILTMAENGQMAIHLPITAARVGAFSTRTAHPDFLERAELVFRSLLNPALAIQNPFLYNTKAEVVHDVCQRHRAAVADTVSCWRASRVTASHCGQCVPCVIRRISLEANGVALDEYEVDLLGANVGGLAPESIGKRNLMELSEFVQFFSKPSSEAEVFQSFPDLISQNFDHKQAIAMYRRFAAEANAVFGAHPNLGILAL